MPPLSEALRLYEGLGSLSGRAAVLEEIGKVHAGSGRYQEALRIHSRELALRRQTRDRRGEAAAFYQMGLNQAALGNYDSAIRYYKDSLLIRQVTGDVSAGANTTAALAGIFFVTGDLDSALSQSSRALTLTDSLSNPISNPKWRAGIHGQRFYRDWLMRVLMKLHHRFPDKDYDVQAFLESDTLRARHLRKRPVERVLTRATIQQEILDENTMLLEYWLSNAGSYLWVLTSNTFLHFQLAPSPEIEQLVRGLHRAVTARGERQEAESIEHRRKRISEADATYEKLAFRLSQILLPPEIRNLKKRLLIVGDGPLLYVPFSALPNPFREEHKFLNSDHEIVNLPSAAVAIGWRRSRIDRKPGRGAFILADPVFDSQDSRIERKEEPRIAIAGPILAAVRAAGTMPTDSIPRLPFSRREADVLRRIIPERREVSVFTGFDATRAAIFNHQARGLQIAHIAAHGLINDDPDLSGLVLSLVDRQGRAVDGFLRVQDVYNMDFPIWSYLALARLRWDTKSQGKAYTD